MITRQVIVSDAQERLVKKIWKDEKTTNEWKTKNLEILVKRMNTKQLDTFMESYNFKIKNGISLIKKKFQEIK